MGRGLSKLQTTILVTALANREARSDGRHVDVYYDEVLIAFYGWPARLVWGRRANGQHFNVAEIGKRKYDAGNAALSRAMIRLEHRGLITRHRGAYAGWSGAKLTEAGKAVAHRLTAETRQTSDNTQPIGASRFSADAAAPTAGQAGWRRW